MNKFLVIIFLLSVFFLSFLPVKDTDFGWHYRCGNQFLETGKLCLKNEFSYFLSNYKAFNPSFLYDITLAFVYNHFGFLGVSFLGAFIFALSAFFILRLFSGPLWLRMIAFYLIFWLSYSILGLGLRSQMVSFLFFVITLFVLTRKSAENRNWLDRKSKLVIENGKKKIETHSLISNLLILPPIFLIWVNAHIGFFIGQILLGIFVTSQIATNFNFKSITFNFSLLTFNFLVTLLNPFGLKVYLEIFRHFQAPLNTMIAEWVTPPMWQKILIITLSMIAFIINVGVRLNIFSISLLLFFTLITLQARRNLPFFYTIFFYTILYSRLTYQLINQLDHDRDQVGPINQLSFCFLLALVFVFAAINIPQTLNFYQSWETYCRKGLVVYPCQAIEKTNLKQLSGHLYTAYEWGGFLIWQTPNLKVFTDGRMSAWKDENGQYPYQVYLYIIQAQKGWNEILKKHKTDYLLIQSGTFLDLELQKNAEKYGWKETYRDDVAAFYKRI
jgi:hypothetical protein